MSDVRLTSTRPASAGLLVESPAVTIAPAFLSMLTMHPGVRVKANLYDGVVNVTIRPSGGGTAISYDLDSVELARQQLWTIPGASAAGALSGSGNLLLSSDDIAEAGDGVLSAAGLTFTSAFASSPIRLGDGHSKFKLDDGTLTIEEFTTSGGDLTLTAEGTIQLAPDPGESELAIQFTLSTSPAAAAQLAILLATLPAPPRPGALPPDRHPERPRPISLTAAGIDFQFNADGPSHARTSHSSSNRLTGKHFPRTTRLV